MSADHDRLVALADSLERTMRGLGAWTEPAPPLQPFRMPFEHWLQLVLVPRLREIAASGAALPKRSGLAAHAVREFGGRDDLTPVTDLLRAIDDACPPASTPAGTHRRATAALALIVLLLGWSAIAIAIGQRGASLATHIFPARVVQTWTGTAAPGPDFQPLRITVAAEVDGADTLRPRDASLLVLRSPTTMRRGPTAPLRFAAKAPPATADVITWLTAFGVTSGPAAEHAANEAVALVRTAATARTRAALHALRLDHPTQPHPDPLIELVPQAPAWVELAVTIVTLLAGAIPITVAIVRYARRS